MSKKLEFIKYVDELIAAAPNVQPSDEASKFWEALSAYEAVEKEQFTDNGKLILRFLQEHSDTTMWKARDIAEELFVSSRMVSGAMRKLVTDGYVDKLGENPVIYSLTENGKNIDVN